MDFPGFPSFPGFPPPPTPTTSVPPVEVPKPTEQIPNNTPPPQVSFSASPAEIKKVTEAYFESLARTEDLLSKLDNEKVTRSNLVKKLREELNVTEDLDIDGMVYTSRRKGDTWFLCRMTRRTTKV